ncbi:hypothetical protein TNCV_2358961 [Trichonephila clavipes]|nr:hypothetical protein TNCV_2358961 [Trichonephila clavipes]
MVSLGHPSFPPRDLGRLDDEEASPGVRPLQNKVDDVARVTNLWLKSRGSTLSSGLKKSRHKEYSGKGPERSKDEAFLRIRARSLTRLTS